QPFTLNSQDTLLLDPDYITIIGGSVACTSSASISCPSIVSGTSTVAVADNSGTVSYINEISLESVTSGTISLSALKGISFSGIFTSGLTLASGVNLSLTTTCTSSSCTNDSTDLINISQPIILSNGTVTITSASSIAILNSISATQITFTATKSIEVFTNALLIQQGSAATNTISLVAPLVASENLPLALSCEGASCSVNLTFTGVTNLFVSSLFPIQLDNSTATSIGTISINSASAITLKPTPVTSPVTPDTSLTLPSGAKLFLSSDGGSIGSATVPLNIVATTAGEITLSAISNANIFITSDHGLLLTDLESASASSATLSLESDGVIANAIGYEDRVISFASISLDAPSKIGSIISPLYIASGGNPNYISLTIAVGTGSVYLKQDAWNITSFSFATGTINNLYLESALGDIVLNPAATVSISSTVLVLRAYGSVLYNRHNTFLINAKGLHLYARTGTIGTSTTPFVVSNAVPYLYIDTQNNMAHLTASTALSLGDSASTLIIPIGVTAISLSTYSGSGASVIYGTATSTTLNIFKQISIVSTCPSDLDVAKDYCATSFSSIASGEKNLSQISRGLGGDYFYIKTTALEELIAPITLRAQYGISASSSITALATADPNAVLTFVVTSEIAYTPLTCSRCLHSSINFSNISLPYIVSAYSELPVLFTSNAANYSFNLSVISSPQVTITNTGTGSNIISKCGYETDCGIYVRAGGSLALSVTSAIGSSANPLHISSTGNELSLNSLSISAGTNIFLSRRINVLDLIGSSGSYSISFTNPTNEHILSLTQLEYSVESSIFITEDLLCQSSACSKLSIRIIALDYFNPITVPVGGILGSLSIKASTISLLANGPIVITGTLHATAVSSNSTLDCQINGSAAQVCVSSLQSTIGSSENYVRIRLALSSVKLATLSFNKTFVVSSSPYTIASSNSLQGHSLHFNFDGNSLTDGITLQSNSFDTLNGLKDYYYLTATSGMVSLNSRVLNENSINVTSRKASLGLKSGIIKVEELSVTANAGDINYLGYIEVGSVGIVLRATNGNIVASSGANSSIDLFFINNSLNFSLTTLLGGSVGSESTPFSIIVQNSVLSVSSYGNIVISSLSNLSVANIDSTGSQINYIILKVAGTINFTTLLPSSSVSDNWYLVTTAGGMITSARFLDSSQVLLNANSFIASSDNSIQLYGTVLVSCVLCPSATNPILLNNLFPSGSVVGFSPSIMTSGLIVARGGSIGSLDFPLYLSSLDQTSQVHFVSSENIFIHARQGIRIGVLDSSSSNIKTLNVKSDLSLSIASDTKLPIAFDSNQVNDTISLLSTGATVLAARLFANSLSIDASQINTQSSGSVEAISISLISRIGSIAQSSQPLLVSSGVSEPSFTSFSIQAPNGSQVHLARSAGIASTSWFRSIQFSSDGVLPLVSINGTEYSYHYYDQVIIVAGTDCPISLPTNYVCATSLKSTSGLFLRANISGQNVSSVLYITQNLLEAAVGDVKVQARLFITTDNRFSTAGLAPQSITSLSFITDYASFPNQTTSINLANTPIFLSDRATLTLQTNSGSIAALDTFKANSIKVISYAGSILLGVLNSGSLYASCTLAPNCGSISLSSQLGSIGSESKPIQVIQLFNTGTLSLVAPQSNQAVWVSSLTGISLGTINVSNATIVANQDIVITQSINIPNASLSFTAKKSITVQASLTANQVNMSFVDGLELQNDALIIINSISFVTSNKSIGSFLFPIKVTTLHASGIIQSINISIANSGTTYIQVPSQASATLANATLSPNSTLMVRTPISNYLSKYAQPIKKKVSYNFIGSIINPLLSIFGTDTGCEDLFSVINYDDTLCIN
ncbi:MAG: hypothetical protein QM538_02415, partial [Methylacidiphilales bacterium]|nr:hypothetical protein [Candidatus Methylacidiphilales bacterium]